MVTSFRKFAWWFSRPWSRPSRSWLRSPRRRCPIFPAFPEPLVSLNTQAAKLFLRRLGIDALPVRIQEKFKVSDVQFVLREVFAENGICVADLQYGSQNRDSSLTRLREAMSLMLAVEEVAGSSSISPEPIFAALSQSVDAVRDLFERFKRVVEVWQYICASSTDFPIHKQFKETFAKQCANWSHLPTATLLEAEEVHRAYLTIQEKVQQTLSELDEYLRRLHPLSTKDPELNDILLHVGRSKDVALNAIRTGTVSPMEGLSSLQDLLSDCEGLATEFVDPHEHYYAILGVPLGAAATDITKAYRKLSKKYHPDAGGHGHPDFVEKFRQIQEAYDVLKRLKP